MTPRELRTVLFEMDDQNMTIAELRHILFNLIDQDCDNTPQEMARSVRIEKTFQTMKAQRVQGGTR